jgi:hypothetical protein
MIVAICEKSLERRKPFKDVIDELAIKRLVIRPSMR